LEPKDALACGLGMSSQPALAQNIDPNVVIEIRAIEIDRSR
jgi:hypothetical protein